MRDDSILDPASDAETIVQLAQARLDARRRRILAALNRAGCTFKGRIERRHQPLARQLERVDAENNR